MRAVKNQTPAALDQPLEPEPRAKVKLPKPEPRGSEQPSEDHSSALDGLAFWTSTTRARDLVFMASILEGPTANLWIL